MKVFIANIIAHLNKQTWFRFISSIRLAVPVMLCLIVSVAAGTIFESNYNAEYAKIAVYSTNWFYCLLGFFWINIFTSMMSRFPWKKHHLGFVMVHTGIMILLIGSAITATQGVDGSLQIPEGQQNNTVILPGFMIGYRFEGSPTLNSVAFNKTLSELNKSDLQFINDKIGHVLQVEKFVPFASVRRGYSKGGQSSDAVAVSFGLKSKFFDVKEWLHSTENPEMQMGPAKLKLIIDREGAPQRQAKANPAAKAKSNKQKSTVKSTVKSAAKNGGAFLRISDFNLKKELKTVALEKFERVDVNGIQIRLKKKYSRAMVSANKIVESEDPQSPPNLALELEVEKNGQKLREVLYAKFPGFSLNQSGAFGLKIEFIADANSADSSVETDSGVGAGESTSQLPAGHPQVPMGNSQDVGAGMAGSEMSGSEMGEAGMAGPGMAGGNVIEFHASPSKPSEIRIELWKTGKLVAEKNMQEGEMFQTPWMGMQITVGSVNFGSQPTSDVVAIKPEPGNNLPTSAVFITPVGADKGFWLAQGEVRELQVGNRNLAVVFGNETHELPFSLSLEKFSKKDYPGTTTPYSYESLVKSVQDQSLHLISMNEPLKSHGYTLYQASYVMNPGQPPMTILSVNRDPGRWVKYFGSILLSLGIIVFTLMRSRFYRSRLEGKTK